MSEVLVVFLLFFLHLLVIPFGISPFEAPKVIIAESFIDILLFFKIIKFNKEYLKTLISPQIIFISILLILSLDQSFLFNPQGSFFGNPYRLQGVFLLWHLLVFSILSKDLNLEKLIKTLAPFSLVFLLMGTLILGVNQNGRAFGTLGEPNALSATALFIFPFVFFISKLPLRIGTILATITIVLLSGSRAGLIAFFIQALFILIHSKFKISIPKAAIFSIILIALTLILPFAQNLNWFENRIQVWQSAFEAGLQTPILGHGFGNIQNPIHQAAIKLNNPIQYQVVDSSHNFLLDFFLQGGLVGLLCILILIALTIQDLIRHKKLMELTAFLGLITTMLFNPVSVVNLIAFWWLTGQGESS